MRMLYCIRIKRYAARISRVSLHRTRVRPGFESEA